MSVLEDALRQAAVATAETNDFESLPDGEYIAAIDKITYGLNSKQNPMITYQLSVIEGELSGRKNWKNVVLYRNGEFKPGILRAEMDFIYGLVNAEVPTENVEADFEQLLTEITEASETDQPFIVDMIVKTASKPDKNGNYWTNTELVNAE